MIESITLLLVLIITIILGICSALLVKFIDFCFNEHNILSWYYSLLIKLNTWSPNLAKPLGLCPKCFGLWLSSALFLLYHYYFGLIFILVVPYLAVMEYTLDLLFKDNDVDDNSQQPNQLNG